MSPAEGERDGPVNFTENRLLPWGCASHRSLAQNWRTFVSSSLTPSLSSLPASLPLPPLPRSSQFSSTGFIGMTLNRFTIATSDYFMKRLFDTKQPQPFSPSPSLISCQSHFIDRGRDRQSSHLVHSVYGCVCVYKWSVNTHTHSWHEQ